MNHDDKSVLQIYMGQLKRTRVLERAEEKRLAERAAEGDREAANRIIESNLKFVVSIAMKYRNLGMPVADLINEGNIGLIKALDRFDPSRGVRFISFARWWIRHYILKALFEQSSAIRVPYRQASRVLRGDGADPMKDLLVRVYKPVSLDDVLSEDENGERVMKFVGADEYEQPDEAFFKRHLAEIIESSMSKLKPIEKQVIRYRYGLEGTEPLTFGEIGRLYNLTRERIRQIMNAALVKMRYPMQRSQALSFMTA